MEQKAINGLQIVVSAATYDDFQNGLAIITQKLMDITNVDAVITVVGMKNHVYVVGRASSERVNLLPRSEEHTSELQSRFELVCRLLLEKKKRATDKQ